MKLFNKFKRAIGLKNKYTVREIKEDGRLRAAVILSDKERETLGPKERVKRFEKWRKEQGV